MLQLRIISGLIITTAAVFAQSVTLPPAAKQWPGNRHNSSLFYSSSSLPNEARTQLLYPLADIPLASLTIRQLGFRSIGTIANAASTVDLSISMSTSPRDANNPSATFSVNAPSPATLVFSGSVTLPMAPMGRGTQPWLIQIPLQTPFTLAPASGDRSLIVDVQCRNGTSSRTWYTEQFATISTQDGQGTQVLSQPACLLPNGQPQRQSSFRPDLLHPGGVLSLTLGVYPSNQPSAAMNALVIGFRAQGGTLGGMTLPFALSTVGVPSPSGCLWTVEHAASLPITYNSYGWGGSLSTGKLLPIPNLAGLAGMSFYVQNAAMLQYPSGAKVFPSVAMKFTIGDSVTPSGGSVGAVGNRNASSGVVSPYGPVSIFLQ